MSTIALIGQHADTSKYPWSEPWRRDSLCSEPGSVHAHLVGLPVGHATQEGMFFVEAAALILEGLSSGAPFVIRERLYLIIAET